MVPGSLLVFAERGVVCLSRPTACSLCCGQAIRRSLERIIRCGMHSAGFRPREAICSARSREPRTLRNLSPGRELVGAKGCMRYSSLGRRRNASNICSSSLGCFESPRHRTRRNATRRKKAFDLHSSRECVDAASNPGDRSSNGRIRRQQYI